MAWLLPLHDWSAGWDHVAGKHGAGENVGRLECPDISRPEATIWRRLSNRFGSSVATDQVG